MSERPPEAKSFAMLEAEAEEVTRSIHEQIAKLRSEVQIARARLLRTAREQARDAEEKLPTS
jgi:hypothetical protein